MAKSKLAVGLDIGSSSVKLEQLKEKKGGYQLLAYGAAPLPWHEYGRACANRLGDRARRDQETLPRRYRLM